MIKNVPFTLKAKIWRRRAQRQHTDVSHFDTMQKLKLLVLFNSMSLLMSEQYKEGQFTNTMYEDILYQLCRSISVFIIECMKMNSNFLCIQIIPENFVRIYCKEHVKPSVSVGSKRKSMESWSGTFWRSDLASPWMEEFLWLLLSTSWTHSDIQIDTPYFSVNIFDLNSMEIEYPMTVIEINDPIANVVRHSTRNLNDGPL